MNCAVLVNSWFNQPGVEEVVPRSTYLMVMIALFFIDTVAFIFMQLYFIYDRRQFSNCVLSLAFLSCLIYFEKGIGIYAVFLKILIIGMDFRARKGFYMDTLLIISSSHHQQFTSLFRV
ncbi:MASE4 domain-containing protein [Escherichia coli]